MLEEGSFRGRTADFVVMFLFGGVLMIVSFAAIVYLCTHKLVCCLIKAVLTIHCCLEFRHNKQLYIIVNTLNLLQYIQRKYSKVDCFTERRGRKCLK
jgi:hypothetical protein